MNLSTRLTMAMVSLVVLTAAAIGIISYRTIETTVVPTELARIQANTLLRLNIVDSRARAARAAVAAAARSPAVQGVVGAWETDVDPRDGTRLEAWRERAAELFAAQIAANPDYIQFRLIGTEGDGREVVRVERLEPGGSLRVVPETELQPKGDRSYFQEAIRLAAGDIHISPIELNQELGAVQTPHIPVLRAATPVFKTDGTPFGIVVVNVDMRGIFAELAAGRRAGSALYLVNSEGDYLMHPDPSRAFGFELGARYRLQDEFPALAEEFGAHQDGNFEITAATGEALLATTAFVRLAGRPVAGLMQAIPKDIAIGWGAIVERTSIAVGLAALLFAIALAAFMARSLTRPLTQMAEQVSSFTGNEELSLPVSAAGEAGILARAFDRMGRAVREKTVAMQAEVEERRRAEEAVRVLAERQQIYVAAVQSARDAVITATLDGTITSWNPAAEKMFGFTAEHALGKNISIIATPDQEASQRDNVRRLLRGERIEDLETTRTARDGTTIDLSYNLSPVLGPDGTPAGFCAIARDLTSRKQAEDRFRHAVEASPGAMIMADRNGTIVMVNSETERMFGYGPRELVGRKVEVLLPPRLAGAHEQNRKDFAAQPSRRTMGRGRDLYGRRKDGSEIAVEIGLNPIETREGPMIMASVLDIGERKRAEQLLSARAAELERSNSELEQFAYVASHDLQEPLRMVASYAELLAERYQGKLDAKADKYIQYAVDGAKRMQRLVNDLLAISRIGRRDGRIQPTDMNRVAAGVLRVLGRAIEEAGAEVTVKDLPQVPADEGQIAQVLQNLIGNALKFRKEGVPIRISVDALPSQDGWTFRVADNGIGIEERHSDRIFQMFQRLHARDTYDGSGIGLTIAKKVVERHGGRIWFTSVPGDGTTFHFTLPQAKEKAA